MAHPKHEQVRRRFQFRCGYCGVAEADTGGELTVDHYQPLSANGLDDDGNLVYACFRCNLFKAGYYDPGTDPHSSFRILHPQKDSFAAHIHEDDSGILVALTDLGSFHITVLHLNRPQLIAYRLRVRHMDLLRQRERQLTQMLDQAREMLSDMQRYLDSLT